MTMPNLMNCPHSPDGWCLACVATLTTPKGDARPPVEWNDKGPIGARVIGGDCDDGSLVLRLDDNRWISGIPMSGVRVVLVPIRKPD